MYKHFTDLPRVFHDLGANLGTSFLRFQPKEQLQTSTLLPDSVTLSLEQLLSKRQREQFFLLPQFQPSGVFHWKVAIPAFVTVPRSLLVPPMSTLSPTQMHLQIIRCSFRNNSGMYRASLKTQLQVPSTQEKIPAREQELPATALAGSGNIKTVICKMLQHV